MRRLWYRVKHNMPIRSLHVHVISRPQLRHRTFKNSPDSIAVRITSETRHFVRAGSRILQSMIHWDNREQKIGGMNNAEKASPESLVPT